MSLLDGQPEGQGFSASVGLLIIRLIVAALIAILDELLLRNRDSLGSGTNLYIGKSVAISGAAPSSRHCPYIPLPPAFRLAQQGSRSPRGLLVRTSPQCHEPDFYRCYICHPSIHIAIYITSMLSALCLSSFLEDLD